MKLNDYILAAIRTEATISAALLARLDHASLGLVTEGGEFLDAIKKVTIYGRDFDAVNAKEELGDELWYLAIGMNAIGVDFDKFIVDTEVSHTPTGSELVRALKWASNEAVFNASDLLNFCVHKELSGAEITPEERTDVHIALGKVYASIVTRALLLGVSLEDVADVNIAKLRARYPEKFTEELATVKRDVGAERVVLEQGFAA